LTFLSRFFPFLFPTKSDCHANRLTTINTVLECLYLFPTNSLGLESEKGVSENDDDPSKEFGADNIDNVEGIANAIEFELADNVDAEDAE